MAVLGGIRVRCNLCRRTAGVETPGGGGSSMADIFRLNDRRLAAEGWLTGRVLPWRRGRSHVCPRCAVELARLVDAVSAAIEDLVEGLDAERM